ncbi:MAG: tetratricopeptide repeat protein [Nitrospirae bacterium]|nr:tetratricopeptide repeat protein [Nitrospirota bacterium]
MDFVHKTIGGLVLLVSVLALSSCSLPRIVVLDDPLTPEEHVNLGVVYEREGRYDDAVREYGKASDRLPVAILYMGNAYFLKGDLGKAEECYREAMRRDPDNADAMNNLAWLYYRLGRNLDEAEALVIRAMETRPDKADAYRDTLIKIQRAREER